MQERSRVHLTPTGRLSPVTSIQIIIKIDTAHATCHSLNVPTAAADEFLFFFFFFRRTYSCAVWHSHWLIYHVFLFPKWIDTQNAAPSFTHSANVLLRLPSVASVDYCKESRTIERVCTLSFGCVPEQEYCSERTRTNDDNLPFSSDRIRRADLNRLFIRIYYFHSLIRQYVSCAPPPPCERTNPIKYSKGKKKWKTKWGSNFPTGKRIFYISME